MMNGELRLQTEKLSGGIALVEVAGYINNEGGERLSDTALSMFREGDRKVLIDLEGTRIINSIGVSILLEMLEHILDERGTLSFCSLSPTIAKTFEIMGLSQYADIFPDRKAAVAALSDSGEA